MNDGTVNDNIANNNISDIWQHDIPALQAKFEAQKIAFSVLTFNAVNALLELGILKEISLHGETGVTVAEIAGKTKVSRYGVGVLCEAALGMGVVKLAGNRSDQLRFILGKTGYFLLEDDMTRVNFNFARDVCCKGAFLMADSVRNGTPEGLKVFGRWSTIYEGLTSLPECAKKSWFEFDHFYSDLAFHEALPIVFGGARNNIFDLGGNTAKWAIACCNYDSTVNVKILDLPSQTSTALKNAKEAGFERRISVCPCNVLDERTAFPAGADAWWMSQFLDCFSLEDVTRIIKKICAAAADTADIFVLEPFWDKQRFEASAFSLQAISLYFTCMANGRSKMYRYNELVKAIESGGLELKTAHHNIGSNAYSLLHFKKPEQQMVNSKRVFYE